MQIKTRLIPTIFILLILGIPLYTFDNIGAGGILDSTNKTLRLISPPNKEIILTGKKFLEFKWEPNSNIDTDHYEFRLYKSYNIIGPNLIFEKNLYAEIQAIRIDSNFFSDKQVYTWLLKQVGIRGTSVDQNSNSFTIIKK